MNHRVSVVGTSCSGKTTFARVLSRKLAVPHIELDALHWLPNWVERDLEDFRALTAEAVSEDAWVCDGNYSMVRDVVWERANTIVWLDFPFYLVLYRALGRTLHRVFTRKKLYSNNVESFRQAFLSRDSIIWWVITTYGERKRRYDRLLREDSLPGREIVILRSPAEADRYLSSAGVAVETGVLS